MNTEGRSTVIGVFRNSSDARDAIEDLKDSGFDARDIGIVMKDREEAGTMAEETGTRAGEGAATGLVGGGILGGLAGWLVGIGALAIPGVGPFIAAGAFGTAIAGAGIGAWVGAIVGALVGMGVPKEEAQWYADEVKGGRTLVTVNSLQRFDEAETILHDHGAYDIQHRDAGMMDVEQTGTSYGRTGEYMDDTRFQGRGTSGTVPLSDEQSRSERERAQAGELGFGNEGDYDIVGGENFPMHDHQWVNGRCEVCGAVRRRRAA